MGTMLGSQLGENQEGVLRPELAFFDRNADPALDELTELAAVLCGADYAYLGWMDYSRLWFKARFGFHATDQPRSSTACQWTLESGAPLLVTDASRDSRFPPEGIQLVGGLPCLSYAGIPLINSAQQIVGTMAVLSRQPGQFKAEHLTLLDILGRQAVTRLELYSRIRAQELAQRARQRTERALAIERCFVAATLDSIPALVTVLDTAGRIVRMNYSCAQLTGLSLAGAVGRPFVDELLEPQDREWVSGKLREAVAGLTSGPHETIWRAAGGAKRRVSWTLRPLQGPNQEIQYLILSGQDVTDTREMEIALHSTEARYREVVENSLGFVFTCTMDGRLTSLNAFTAETLGYRAEDLVGRMVQRAHGSRHRGHLPGDACAPSKPAASGRARCRSGAATASTGASPSAAAAWSCPVNIPSSSTTAWTLPSSTRPRKPCTWPRASANSSSNPWARAFTASTSKATSPSSTKPARKLSASRRSSLPAAMFTRCCSTATPTAPRIQKPPIPSSRRCAAPNPFACATKSSGARTALPFPSSTAPTPSWRTASSPAW